MIARVLIVLVCFVGGAGVIARAERSESVPARTSFASFPMQVGEWRGVQDPPMDPQVLAVLGVNDYLTRAYFQPDKAGVGLYIGYWESQRQGDTIHSPLNCLPGAGWAPVSKNTIDVPSGIGSEQIAINRYVVRKGLDSQVILYWYQSHGRVVASEYWSRLFLIRDAVRLNRTDGAIVRVIAPVLSDTAGAESAAEQLAARFVTALFPRLSSYLPL
ncbi:MAG TPA: EpsI family protein [Vicinamibacterales bacterium]|jgi:EpsI family protein|nr:EpsI family protein [Vicinamibacterales bacterium]